jgi:glycosyltransferase involved in cell wall biosynthesis
MKAPIVKTPPPREPFALSLCVIARNEGHNLGRCLQSVQGYVRQIVVVINDCTDDTEAVAKSYGAAVYTHPWHGDRDQRNIALGYATEDWVLVLDADEALSEPLKATLQAFFQGPLCQHYSGASFARCTQYLGRWIRHGDWYPDRCLRLFKRTKGITRGMPRHPKVVVDGAVVKLPGDILHYSYPTLTLQWNKVPSFADDFVQTRRSEGKRFWLPEAIGRALWRFVRGYVFKLGFLDGYRGFYIAVFAMASTLFRYTRLWEAELQQGKPGQAKHAPQAAQPKRAG